ncbi:hypothetical protein MKW98_005698, partial [Papaver atlanticum]
MIESEIVVTGNEPFHLGVGRCEIQDCIRSMRFEEGDEIQVMQEMVADAKSGVTN